MGKYIIYCLFYFIPIALSAFVEQETDSRGTPVPQMWLKEVSFEVTRTSLRNALSDFSRQSGLYLNFTDSIIPDDYNISINEKNIPAIKILQKILQNTGLEFIVSQSQQIILVISQKKQNKARNTTYTISGFIVDAQTGEVLSGADVSVKDIFTGTSSNIYGFYSLTLPAGDYTLEYSYLGYSSQTVKVNLDKNIRRSVELTGGVLTADTITVTANSEEDFLKSTEVGTIRLSPKELKTTPVLFGEQDILKALHLLPGVTLTREGDSGFNVRGGDSDQNLVLLDEAPVYNAFHFFGFLSVFNSDAVKDFKLIKGPAPPKYGGKLSSVLDIQMNEGNYKEYNGNISIGSIFSRFRLEGPIKKDKSSFIISGRRTYADVFVRLLGPDDVKNSALYFYDFNIKTNYRASQTDRVYLSGYFGQDVLDINDVLSNNWGNQTATLRWNHVFNQKLFLNSSLILSNFSYNIKVDEDDSEDENSVEVKNRITAVTLKEDYQYYLNTHNTFDFGLQLTSYSFLPGDFSATGNGAFYLQIGKRKAREIAAYSAHEWQATDLLKLNYGLRYSYFLIDGRGDFYDFSDVTDVPSIDFHDQESAGYGGFEPRITANYQLNATTNYKFGYARNYQNIHMISKSTPGTPLDVWQPSSSRLKPQYSDQVSVGYFRNLRHNTYNLSLELFYKSLRNQVDFKNGAEILTSTLFESNLVYGTGYAYGIELLIRRKFGKLTGWLGYSLSKTRRKFEEINQGKSFPPKFDRTHDFSIVTSYRLNDRWTLAANWVYFTGNAMTIPYGKYAVNGQIIEAYSERNAYRMPAYHRLDFSCTYTMKKGHTWNFSLYNAYGRKNAYAILMETDSSGPEKLSLFSFVPSLSFNYNF